MAKVGLRPTQLKPDAAVRAGVFDPINIAALDGGIEMVWVDAFRVEKVLRPAGHRGLMMLGAGSRVENPAEVLSSSRLDQLMQRLKERFHYVVIDTPPVLPSTDAGVLSAAADGTLLVVRLEHSLKKQSRDAWQVLSDMGGNVLGSFVNEVRGQDPDSDRRLAYDPLPEAAE